MVKKCGNRGEICHCKGILAYGIKTEDPEVFFNTSHKLMITYGVTACDARSFFGNPQNLFYTSATRCLCIDGEFEDLPEDKFVIPVYVSSQVHQPFKRSPYYEYGQQQVPNLKCNGKHKIEPYNDFEDKNIKMLYSSEDGNLNLQRLTEDRISLSTDAIVVLAQCDVVA